MHRSFGASLGTHWYHVEEIVMDGSKHDLPYHVRHSDNRHMAVASCLKCGGECTINLSKPLPSDVILKKFKKLGFDLMSRHGGFKCISCLTKKEKKAREQEMANLASASRISVTLKMRLQFIREGQQYLVAVFPTSVHNMLDDAKFCRFRMSEDGRWVLAFTNQENSQTVPVRRYSGKQSKQMMTQINTERLNASFPKGACRQLDFTATCHISQKTIETDAKIGDILSKMEAACKAEETISAGASAEEQYTPGALGMSPVSQPVSEPVLAEPTKTLTAAGHRLPTTPSPKDAWSIQHGTDLRTQMNEWLEIAVQKGYAVHVNVKRVGQKKIPQISINCNLEI